MTHTEWWVQIKQSAWIPLGFGSGHFCCVRSEGRLHFGIPPWWMASCPLSALTSGTVPVRACAGGLVRKNSIEKWENHGKCSLNYIKDLWNFCHSVKNPVIFTQWSCPPWLRLGKRPIQCYILIIYNTKTFAVLFKIQLSFRLCSAWMFSSKTDCWGWQEQSEKAALTFLPDTSIVTPTVGN